MAHYLDLAQFSAADLGAIGEWSARVDGRSYEKLSPAEQAIHDRTMRGMAAIAGRRFPASEAPPTGSVTPYERLTDRLQRGEDVTDMLPRGVTITVLPGRPSPRLAAE